MKKLNKLTVKVVKKSTAIASMGDQITPDAAPHPSVARASIYDTVERWVSERRQNSRDENVFSHSTISAWRSRDQSSDLTNRPQFQG
jgi:hypothetical protein